MLTGFQLLMVIVAWLAVTFPDVIFYADGTTLSLLNQSAPPKTQLVLGMTLLIGAILFSPILLYLFLFLNVL